MRYTREQIKTKQEELFEVDRDYITEKREQPEPPLSPRFWNWLFQHDMTACELRMMKAVNAREQRED